MSLGKPDPDELVPDLDLGWSTRGLRFSPDDLRLFGCAITDRADTIGREGVGPLQLAAASQRPLEWWSALLRGEFVPTPVQLENIGETLETLGAHEFDAAGVLLDLHLEPWGTEACELREKFGLDPHPPSREDETSGSGALLPPAIDLDRHDPQLTMAPMLAVIVTTGILLALAKGADGQPLAPIPNPETLTLLAALAATFGAFAIPKVSAYLSIAGRAVRSKQTRVHLAALERRRRLEFTHEPRPTAWFQASELRHVPIELRSLVRKRMLGAELWERYGLVAIWAFALTSIVAVSEIVADESTAPWWCIGAVALFWVAATIRKALSVAAAEARSALLTGLGYRAPSRSSGTWGGLPSAPSG